MSYQWPVLPKRRATAKKAIWSENVMTVMSGATNEHFLNIQVRQSLDNPVCPLFFNPKSETLAKPVETEPHRDPPNSGDKTPLPTTPVTVKLKKQQNLLVTAANRWKTTALATHSGNEWLAVNADKAGCVVSLTCSVCKTYAEKLKKMKNF